MKYGVVRPFAAADAGASRTTATVLLVAIVLVVAGSAGAAFSTVVETAPESAPAATLDVRFANLDDGVARNDTMVLVHRGGDRLDRERIEVRVGGDVVYNETADSESNSAATRVPGLVVEVDDDDFNDLNKPCRLSPPSTCGGPPGDGDGSDPGVVLQWGDNVTAGQRLVVQERTHPRAYDVIDPGETVRVVYRDDGTTYLLAETTVPEG